MSSPIQTAKDKDRDSLLMYAPSWARALSGGGMGQERSSARTLSKR